MDGVFHPSFSAHFLKVSELLLKNCNNLLGVNFNDRDLTDMSKAVKS